jgi:hypothetical protein
MTSKKKPSLKTAVSRALRESMLTYETYADQTQFAIHEDMSALRQVQLIVDTVLAISQFRGDLYTLETNKCTGRRYVEASLPGKALHMCVKSPPEEMLQYFHAHTLHPHVQAYTRVISLHGVRQFPIYDLKTYMDDAAEDWVTRMNACGASLRIETNTAEFKTAIQKSRRSCNKNYKNFISYLIQLFKKNGRILGIRVDFGYKKRSNFDAAGADVPYEEAKRHREAVVDEIRKRFEEVLLGYVWKFEYGLLKGYHTHFLIFLDGSKVREDVTIVKMLGARWNDEISEGKGTYHNCNAKKESYRFCGIGMLYHDDPNVWVGLEKIATYLTKPDHYVRLNMPGNDHALGKGGPPKLHCKKRGRPRKS